MNNVEIKILTPIHIGSGNTLRPQIDFEEFSYDDFKTIGIIAPELILQKVGVEKITNWVNGVNIGQSLKEIFPNINIESVSKRLLDCYYDGESKDLKEFIHDGMGKPYIPGSSIKGAIRTSILASLISSNVLTNQEEDWVKISNNCKTYKDLNKKINANSAEKSIFGDDPNHDIMRFVQISDAIFGSLNTLALKMVNINERDSQGYWDISKPSLLEVLAEGDSSRFTLKINKDAYSFARGKNANFKSLPINMESISALFQTINHHTLNLVNSEIDYWCNKRSHKGIEKVEMYVDKLETIREEIDGCGKNGESCVLRLGSGSGWRFITGDWTRKSECFDDIVVEASRPNNYNYEGYDFPKSRRVDMGDSENCCDILGFVKLTQI